MSNCKVIQRCIVSIHPCPPNNRVPCEAGSHPDSQAPCVVYHQITTPFPADEELVRIDVREHSIEARLCLFHPQVISLEISVSSRTRPRNVKMVSISPKLKTAVCGWTGTLPRFWPFWNRWLGHVYQSSCSPHHQIPDSSEQRASE